MLPEMFPCLGRLQRVDNETKKLGLSFHANHCVNWGLGGGFPEVSKGKITFIETISAQHVYFSFDPV